MVNRIKLFLKIMHVTNDGNNFEIKTMINLKRIFFVGGMQSEILNIKNQAVFYITQNDLKIKYESTSGW